MHMKALRSPRPAASFPGLRYGLLVQSMLSFKSPVWSSPRSPDYSNYQQSQTCMNSTFRYHFGWLNDTIENLDLDSLIHL
jgi:hypothetical protein